MIQGDIKNTTYYKYAQQVLEGKIIACYYVQLACKRFLQDLNREDLIFNCDKVTNVISFISTFKHNTGQFVGKPFILLAWQQFVVANIYGFYYSDGTRRFTTAYIEIARKNGKTQLAAALALYSLIADGENAAQVIAASNSKEQAKILLQAATALTKSIDPNHKYLTPYRSEIKFQLTDSFLKIVSADTSKLDGLNCSTFIIDEYHEAPNTKMWDVLRSSQGMRRNPLGIIITTSGFAKEKPCYKKREVGLEVLHNLKQDDSFFCIVYTLDNKDDWTDERVWIKACPCLGVTVTKKYMRDQINSALLNPSEEVGVKTKLCNLWCDVADVWLPESYIVKASKNIRLEDFRDCECYIGVDLSATSDLTAVSYLIEKDNIYYFKTNYYLPESALVDKPDRETYKLWKQQGLITITAGNVTDYDYITNDIVAASNILNIQKIGYDKWNATQWAIHATEIGLPLEEYPQTMGNFNRPTKELERLILSGNTVIDNNEITRWCFRNVELKSDYNGNVKPNKGIKSKKIDGVIAIIQALGMYLTVPHYSNEILTI